MSNKTDGVPYRKRLQLWVLLGIVCFVCDQDESRAQNPVTQNPVVKLRREPMQLISSEKFHVNLSLQPDRLLMLAAPANGTVLSLQVAPGENIQAQRDCVRLDDTRQQVVVKRGEAELEGARIEYKIASEKGDSNQQSLTKAKVEVAELDLKLALLDQEALTCRAPFAGLVLKQHAFPGQIVRQGDPLLTIADVTKLKAEVPVDRTVTKVGQEVELLTDQNVVKGKVIALLPPTDEYKALLQIIPGLALAIITVNEQGGALLPGQTIYSKLVPQDFVSLVPTEVISAHTEGRRKVQVIRNGMVRDVVVEALAQRGNDRVYVTGSFALHDELVLSTSTPLKDGQRITVAENAPATEGEGTPAAAPAQPATTKKQPGF